MSAKTTPPPTFPATITVNRQRMTGGGPAEELRELVIEMEQPGFRAEAGQSIGVVLPPDPSSQESFHLRWYSIADAPATDDRKRTNVTIYVRRIVATGPDGSQTRGWASNYLCDATPGMKLNVTAPHGIPFPLPKDKNATLILIGAGTGIAPFRMFVKTLYRKQPDRKGPVRLFYGTRNGLDVMYANDPEKDVMQYFDDETFKAFQALSPPPNWADPIAWDLAFSERGDELLKLLEQPGTSVYVAGREEIGRRLDQFFSALTGSANRWNMKKSEMKAAGRWTELLY